MVDRSFGKEGRKEGDLSSMPCAAEAVNCACFVPTLLVEFTNYLERSPQEALEAM